MPNKIVIIGNGISGVTCARNIRKQSQDEITIISSETEHFYSRTALMYIFMGHMKYEHTKPYEDWFWKKNNLTLLNNHVTAIDIQNKKVQLQNGTAILYDILVLATGSVSNKPQFPGIELKGIQSLYGIPDLELMTRNIQGTKKAVIIGGGLIGIEMAEMLLSRNIEVTFLVRESAYWNNVLPGEEAELIARHIRGHHVILKTGTELKEIRDDGNGRVGSIITKSGEEIKCGFLGLTVGVSPNTSLLQNTEIEKDRGILVNEFFETNVPGIFAIGDCVQHRKPPMGRKPVEQVWYTGRMHGETLAQTICGKKTAYNPGPWYNSAKFFDIEYQTYGIINPQPADDESNFYWEHENGKISFRIVYNKNDESVIGFNVLGIRLRHELCDKWLIEKRKVDDVMSHLSALNFDPEFYKKYERTILDSYNNKTGKKVKSKRKKALSFF